MKAYNFPMNIIDLQMTAKGGPHQLAGTVALGQFYNSMKRLESGKFLYDKISHIYRGSKTEICMQLGTHTLSLNRLLWVHNRKCFD